MPDSWTIDGPRGRNMNLKLNEESDSVTIKISTLTGSTQFTCPQADLKSVMAEMFPAPKPTEPPRTEGTGDRKTF